MCKCELIHSAGLFEWLPHAKYYVVDEMQTVRNLVGERSGYIIVMQFGMMHSREICLGVQGGQRGRSLHHLNRTSERGKVKWVLGRMGGGGAGKMVYAEETV